MEFRRWCTSGEVAECSTHSGKSTFVAPFERHRIQMEFRKWCSSGQVAECLFSLDAGVGKVKCLECLEIFSKVRETMLKVPTARVFLSQLDKQIADCRQREVMYKVRSSSFKFKSQISNSNFFEVPHVTLEFLVSGKCVFLIFTRLELARPHFRRQNLISSLPRSLGLSFQTSLGVEPCLIQRARNCEGPFRAYHT